MAFRKSSKLELHVFANLDCKQRANLVCTFCKKTCFAQWLTCFASLQLSCVPFASLLVCATCVHLVGTVWCFASVVFHWCAWFYMLYAVSYCSRLQIRTIAIATCVGYVRSIANLVVQHLQTCFFLCKFLHTLFATSHTLSAHWQQCLCLPNGKLSLQLRNLVRKVCNKNKWLEHLPDIFSTRCKLGAPFAHCGVHIDKKSLQTIRYCLRVLQHCFATLASFACHTCTFIVYFSPKKTWFTSSQTWFAISQKKVVLQVCKLGLQVWMFSLARLANIACIVWNPIVQCCRQQVWFGKSMCKLCVHICKNGLVHLQTSIASLQTRLGILQMCFCCRISVWTFVLQMLFLRIRNFCVHLCKPWLVNLQYYIANLQNLVCSVCFAKLAMLALQTCQLSKYANFFFANLQTWLGNNSKLWVQVVKLGLRFSSLRFSRV